MNLKYFLFLLLVLPHLTFSQRSIDFEKGLTFYNNFENDSAIHYFEKYKESISESIDSTKSNALVHYYLGRAYKLKQDYDLAIKNYNVADSIYRALQDHEGLANTYIAIAEFYRAKHDFISSENYLDLTKSLIEKYEISNRILANYYNRRAAVYTEKDRNHVKSIEFSKKVIEIAQKLDDKSLEASSLNEIAFAYENLNNPLAERYYLESLKIYQSLNNKLYQSSIISNLCRWFYKQGRIVEVKSYLDKGYNICEQNEFLENKRVFSQLYAWYYEEAGDLKKALFYNEQFRTLEKNELINKWNDQLIDTERKYELDQKNKELEIKNLSIENQASALENEKSRSLILIMIVSGLLIATMLIAVFFRKVKKKNKSLKILSQQNEVLLSEANHRINNNLQLIIILITDELKKISEDESSLMKKLLTKVESISTLYRHLYQNKEKTEIDILQYTKDLFINLNELLTANKIKTEVVVEDFSIKADNALLIGLLLTELCINSIKHAFKNQDDKLISFDLTKQDSLLVFSYKDNGHTTMNKKMKPLLVDKLCRQLRVDYSIDTTNGFSFIFKKVINKK